MSFTLEDLIQLYGEKKELYGIDAYRHISEILKEAKILHKKYFMTTGKLDHEQSWRAFKGKNLEKLIIHILTDEIHALGLKITLGNTIEQTSSSNLDKVMDRVKRNLLVDYGEFGMHLPDVDIIFLSGSLYHIRSAKLDVSNIAYISRYYVSATRTRYMFHLLGLSFFIAGLLAIAIMTLIKS